MMKEETPLLHKFACFKMDSIRVRNYLFLKKYVTSKGGVSHNVLYYQQLSIGRYQVSYNANVYFE